jgi:hypothetical protein
MIVAWLLHLTGQWGYFGCPVMIVRHLPTPPPPPQQKIVDFYLQKWSHCIFPWQFDTDCHHPMIDCGVGEVDNWAAWLNLTAPSQIDSKFTLSIFTS